MFACDDDIIDLNTKQISVTGSDTETTIDESEEYNLSITGSNNIVTIKNNNIVKRLKLSGRNNLLTIGDNTSVEDFDVSGSDNTIYVPVNSGISFSNQGVGNQLIEQ